MAYRATYLANIAIDKLMIGENLSLIELVDDDFTCCPEAKKYREDIDKFLLIM
jgi:hypothetical protein